LSDSRKNNSLPRKTIDFLIKWLGLIFGTGSILVLVAIIFVVLYGIFARVFLPKSPEWGTELPTYLFVYCIVFASGIVISKKRHVALEVFHDKLPKTVGLIYGALCHIVVVVFCIMILPYSWDFLLVGVGEKTTTLPIEKSWLNASMLIFFILVPLTSLLMAASNTLSIFEKEQE
jgi:TRAP-type transport system small permease protein